MSGTPFMKVSPRNPRECGVFTVSLDFELYWGVRDHKSIDQYRANLEGVRNAIRTMLDFFAENGIHVTWATVGFLFYSNEKELKANFPKLLPQYSNRNLCPYEYLKNETIDVTSLHFAPDMVEEILKYSDFKQELASHTFCHYYCLEEGQSINEFEQDLLAFINVSEKRGITPKSIVFPRNQWNAEYLVLMQKYGITNYRGNESNKMFHAGKQSQQSPFVRIQRFLDAYLNLSGPNSTKFDDCISSKPYNFPSSRFLRPYSAKLAPFDKLKLKRIKDSMTYAAKQKEIYHLWWHPHNFGVNLENNISFLMEVVNHYRKLSSELGMISMNMVELSDYADSLELAVCEGRTNV